MLLATASLLLFGTLVGCDPATTASSSGLPQTITIDTTYDAVGSDQTRIVIAESLFKVYAITLLDSTDVTMSSQIEISMTRVVDGDADVVDGDADARLRQGPIAGIPATASPVSGDLMGASVYMFLPGDDGVDLPSNLPEDFAMLWQADADGNLVYPSGSNGPLAANLEYTISVTAADDQEWQLRVTDISDESPPRLPSGIRTRARRGMCNADPLPITRTGTVDCTASGGVLRDADVLDGGICVVADLGGTLAGVTDSVSCGDGGPAINGGGFYLFHSPTANADGMTLQNLRLDRFEDPDPRRTTLSAPDDGADNDNDGLSGTNAVAFHASQDCMTRGPQDGIFLLNTPIGSTGFFTLDEVTELVYCIELTAASPNGNLASDNIQFTLNP